MLLQSLNCTIDNECFITRPNPFNFNIVYFGIIAVFSLFGLILNLVAIYIFSIAIQTKNKFFQLLNYFTINSLLINMFELTFSITYIFIPSVVFEIPNLTNQKLDLYVKNHAALFYMIYIYFSVRQVLFLFAGVFDIFIVYERVQLYNPKWKFLDKKSAIKLALYTILFCLIINVCSFIARRIEPRTISIMELNQTLEVYAYEDSNYDYQEIYDWFLMISNIVKDIITLVFEIIVNILLILALKAYRKQKIRLQTAKTVKQKSIFTKEDFGMVKTALLLSFFSAMLHLLNFGTFLAKKYDTTSNQIYYILIGIFGTTLILIRHSINFFIFLNFNKKFQTEFYRVFCMKKT